MGLLQIYLRPRDMVPGQWHWFWGRRPVYRELVLRAKRAGFLNATAHHTQFGFANRRRIEDQGVAQVCFLPIQINSDDDAGTQSVTADVPRIGHRARQTERLKLKLDRQGRRFSLQVRMQRVC
jgi:PII-like signaling protein